MRVQAWVVANGLALHPEKTHTGDCREPGHGFRSALFYLSPDMPRAEWAEVGMALKSELGEQGFSLFDEWSRGCGKYSARDVRDTWRSIKADGGITIATLYFKARAIGWRYGGDRPTPEEIEAGKRETAKRAEREKDKEARKHAKASEKAAAIWNDSIPATDHPYLKRKAVAPAATLRQITSSKAKAIVGYEPAAKDGEPLKGAWFLVIPIYIGELSSVEFIDEAGLKSALAGGKKSGGYWPAQPLPDGNGIGITLMIGEGVATSLSAREATGHLAIAALFDGNLKAVAKTMRERLPQARLVVLADLIKTTGLPDPHAIEAARAVGGLVAVPDFGADRRQGMTDFNDLHRHHGQDAV